MEDDDNVDDIDVDVDEFEDFEEAVVLEAVAMTELMPLGVLN